MGWEGAENGHRPKPNIINLSLTPLMTETRDFQPVPAIISVLFPHPPLFARPNQITPMYLHGSSVRKWGRQTKPLPERVPRLAVLEFWTVTQTRTKLELSPQAEPHSTCFPS